MSIKYFELWCQRSDEPGGMFDYDLCIKGVRTPTLAEANAFVEDDISKDGLKVVNIRELSREEALEKFNLDTEDAWPVFGETTQERVLTKYV